VLGGVLGIVNLPQTVAVTLPAFCLFVGTAFCSIAGWCGICVFLRNKYMAELGRNSLGIMVIHKYPMLAFQVLLPGAFALLSPVRIAALSRVQVLSLYGVMFVVILYGTLWMSRICQRLAPWSLGRFPQQEAAGSGN